ncbi:MAG: hypothetical protein K0R63_1360 [Rickettsiales bacterium]|jgi:glycosyltransferase involved in cell wall biosynthesis|nr:hypothetical protein [Rickettsiales bacterium]
MPSSSPRPSDVLDSLKAKAVNDNAAYVNPETIRLTKELAQAQCRIAELETQLAFVTDRFDQVNDRLKAVLFSTSWRMTGPLRRTVIFLHKFRYFASRDFYARIWRIARNQGIRKLTKRVISVVRAEGWRGLFAHFRGHLKSEAGYAHWIAAFDTLTESDFRSIDAHIATFPRLPLISIVMPVYNIDETYLRLALDSVLRQRYPHWELCIADDCSPQPHIRRVLEEYQAKDARIKIVFREKNGHISEASNSALSLATGEFVALMDHDDVLREHALYMVAHEIVTNEQADIIYSDEDKVDGEGHRFGQYFKTDWDPDLMMGQNMVCHLAVYRKSILTEIGGFRKGVEGAQDYDLCLRAVAASSFDRIRHIPHILYHWRSIPGSTAHSLDSKNYAIAAGVKAVQDYLDLKETGAKVVEPESRAKEYGYHHVVWPIPDPAPKVSIIIPTRNRMDLLSTCIESIIAKTTYPNYEIVVVDNQSDDPATLTYFETLVSEGKAKILPYPHPFNYSAINNYAVEQSDGEIIALLNNDVEVITPTWLTEMVGQALRSDVGAVGAKLMYPNDKVQHAGVLLGLGDHKVAGHAFHLDDRNELGYYAFAMLTRSVSAVTGACLVVGREKFLQVKGLDEERLKIAFNDVDLCLKLQAAGYRNIFTPFAELYHYESASRGIDHMDKKKFARFEEEAACMRERWKSVLDSDPYYNPNLNVHCGNYTLSFRPRARKPWLQGQEDGHANA